MEPANPPLPTPWNFPFQPELGSHTSNAISESLDGLITPAPRQKAGSFSIAPPPGGLKDPPATDSAVVMVVPARPSVARLSHVAAAAGIPIIMTNASKRRPIRILPICFL